MISLAYEQTYSWTLAHLGNFILFFGSYSFAQETTDTTDTSTGDSREITDITSFPPETRKVCKTHCGGGNFASCESPSATSCDVEKNSEGKNVKVTCLKAAADVNDPPTVVGSGSC